MRGREPTKMEKEMIQAICNLQDEIHELKERIKVLKQINKRYSKTYGPLPLLVTDERDKP